MREKRVLFRHSGYAAVFLLLGLPLFSCADLVVRKTEIDIISESVNGQSVNASGRVIASIRNRGMRGAPESTTSVYVLRDWDYPYARQSNRPTPSLGSRQEIEIPVWSYYTAMRPGDCMLIKTCADTENDVPEGLYESNNCRVTGYMNRRLCPSCDLCCQETLPSQFDWRDWKGKNWITPVRDQGDCGACWAFSAMAAVEAKHNVEHLPNEINHINLAEYELLRCTSGSCDGGNVSTALDFAKKQGIVEQGWYWILVACSIPIIQIYCGGNDHQNDRVSIAS